MPNWTYNTLTVVTDAETAERIRTQLSQTYTRPFSRTKFVDGEWVAEIEYDTFEGDLSFWNIIRPDDSILDEYSAVTKAADTRTGWLPEFMTGPGSLLEENPNDRISNHWYDWNVRNWGTKWDVGGDVDFERDGNDLIYRFPTAWSPPYEAIIALSKQYPTVHFQLDWEEEQGFGAESYIINGEVTIQDEWDIPETHEEHDLRGSACVCEFEDDQQYWYDDCPREGVAA
jgi:hypothetical protein